jgi:hypothetical protein
MKKTLLLLSFLTTCAYSQVSIGTPGSVDSNAGLTTPISNWYATSLSQFIYLASEINASGNITGIQFTLNNTTPLTHSNDMVSVWIGHTTKSIYSPVISATGADWVPVSGQTQVFTNGTLTQVGSAVTVTFSTPFTYNGTDNLVITVDANEPADDGSGVLFYQTAASANKTSLMIRTDQAADNADPNNPPLNYDGTFTATSVQAKNTRPIITLQGITALGIVENVPHHVAIYPNPVATDLFIKSDSNVLSAAFYTVTGQLIRPAKIYNNKIAVDDLASGVYFIKFNLEDGAVISDKFVKE